MLSVHTFLITVKNFQNMSYSRNPNPEHSSFTCLTLFLSTSVKTNCVPLAVLFYCVSNRVSLSGEPYIQESFWEWPAISVPTDERLLLKEEK